MNLETVVIILVVGLIAGWLASFVVGGAGVVRYLVTGLLGALGSYLFSALNMRMPIGDPLLAQIVVAAIGAIVLVLLARLIQRT